MKTEKVNTTPFWRFLFLLYCAVMLWLLFGRSNGWVSGVPYMEQLRQHTSLKPLYTIRNFLYALRYSSDANTVRQCLINLAGNVLLFIPAGWLLPRLWQKMGNFFWFFALCLGAIFLIEVLQMFTLLGVFDVDDILLNLLGMSLGFLFYKLCFRK